jgi:LmbE family N-acetylglucosaminyl deacetylase
MMDLRLLAVLAHPDDESRGTGGIHAKYGREGIETYLLTATRGEQGWFGDPDANPGPDALGRIREEELGNAARALGVRDVALLDYCDGEFDRAPYAEVLSKVAGHIRRARPHVVVTFDHNGLYGHPDHIAISRVTTAATVAAADPLFDPGAAPHAVSKLYYMVWSEAAREAYEAAFGELVMNIDGVERRAVTWPDWAISTWIDTEDCWETVWQAISCHRTQLPSYQKLLDLPQAYHRSLWGLQTYYRVLTTVPVPDRVEEDLFAGLRGTLHA